jgi:threonine dehydrogenase-like Zn-dependent dehydrogenase
LLASILVEPGKIELSEVEMQKPSCGEILVKIEAALTCGTDLKAFLRGHDLIPMPGVFGHEFSGVVAEAGRGVRRFKEGDAVMAVHTAPCLRCFFCKKRLYNLCEKIMHTKVLGAFAEYILLPSHVVAQNVFHKPKNLSFEEAAFLEPLSCVVHSVNPLRIIKGDSALILGAGPIGLLHLLLLKRNGAKVAVADIKEDRLKIAKKLGADFVFRTENSPSPQSPPLKGGEEQGDVSSGKGKHKKVLLSKGKWSEALSSEERDNPSITSLIPPYLSGDKRGVIGGGRVGSLLPASHYSKLNSSTFPFSKLTRLNPRLGKLTPIGSPFGKLTPLNRPLDKLDSFRPLFGKLTPLRPPFGKGGQGGILKRSAAGLLRCDTGFDYVFECTGMPDVWEESVNYVRRGGTVMLFGGCKSGSTATYDTKRLHYDEITLRGVFHYAPPDVKKAYELLREGKLGVSRLISGRYSLQHTQKAFERLAKGQGIKYAIIP